MTELRILADDLTGALDSAARLVATFGPMPVRWTPCARPQGSLVFDTGSREADRVAAVAAVAAALPMLAGADIAFKKIDSLLRGQTAAEIAAATRLGDFRHTIIAPAFPAQGRVTRAGRQWILGDAPPRAVDLDLVAALLTEGHVVSRCRPGDVVPPGVSLWDAETDDDLLRIATAGRSLGASVLWCGSAGLAGAIAGTRAPPRQPLHAPLLGIFGSDSRAIRAQLNALGDRVRALPRDGDIPAAIYDLSPTIMTERDDAARRIATDIARIAAHATPPATALISGGETLRALCLAVDADHLVVDGEFEPGVPLSRIAGGAWSGVRIVSKSGAFGDTMVLQRIVADVTSPQPYRSSGASPS